MCKLHFWFKRMAQWICYVLDLIVCTTTFSKILIGINLLNSELCTNSMIMTSSEILCNINAETVDNWRFPGVSIDNYAHAQYNNLIKTVAGPILIELKNTISLLLLGNNGINDLNWEASNKIWQNFHLWLDNDPINRPVLRR